MAEPIEVGFVTHEGGAHVAAYLDALAATELCGQVVLADPDGRWNAEAQSRLGAKLKSVVPGSQQLYRDHRPQMALVTMEARLAPPHIDAALDAGCHVFAEKPACIHPRDFAPLVAKADRQHRYLMLALANRLNPEIEAARKIIAAGRIGRLYGVELHLIADQTRLTRDSYHGQWYAHRDRAGGGHLIWLGIHWLDLAMYLVDSPLTEVTGFTTNIGGQPIDVEDSATAALRFENGALGTMTSGYYLDKGYHSHLKFWGSEGWVLIEPMKDQPLQWYSTGLDEGDQQAVLQDWSGSKEPRGYTPFVQSAVRACADMSDPPISSYDSLRALRTVFAIYRSAREGKAIKVEA